MTKLKLRQDSRVEILHPQEARVQDDNVVVWARWKSSGKPLHSKKENTTRKGGPGSGVFGDVAEEEVGDFESVFGAVEVGSGEFVV
jgi:hypothetical protein